VSNDQWLELIKALVVAVGIYSAIRVDLARLQVKVENHGEQLARHERLLEK
jgi:hypothetical protein